MDYPKPLWKQRLFSACSVFNTLEAQLQHCCHFNLHFNYFMSHLYAKVTHLSNQIQPKKYLDPSFLVLQASEGKEDNTRTSSMFQGQGFIEEGEAGRGEREG